ncbi:MAG TPA: anthranilate synthase component I [Polyangiales bacterium]|nr:anthranilate synthase component I [Polyangiales bacterium]
MDDQQRSHGYTTSGGLRVTRTVLQLGAAKAQQLLSSALDRQRGLWLASSFEYPGRYKRYDLGFSDPPLSLEARGRRFRLEALNERGELLLRACLSALSACPEVRGLLRTTSAIEGEVPPGEQGFYEEVRTRVPSVFSVVRALCAFFASPEDALLGLYGAFGYDLVFQFEALRQLQPRAASQRDLVLYLPDRVLLIDHERGSASQHSYDFELDGESTAGLPRATAPAPFVPNASASEARDHAPGEFARDVERARQAFAVGDLFEVTPSQVFSRACRALPSAVFDALRRANPAPYGFLANLGDNEFLVGASPEMYARVSGRRVETCPIAGTIRRGSDALDDARQILTLLSSAKDEAELTMCTDVDRNDKARVCEPGSVRVIGRRQIELYSRLIHTVDHVEGVLRDGYDQLDAFLTHLWAVTVTGAPKLDAMQFIEGCERSPRAFYGGAVGAIGFDGSLNTGLTLRTLHIRAGVAHLRAGATLNFDSDPAEEERESELKASALFAALERAEPRTTQPLAAESIRVSARLPVLLIDHRDSFVHTLADYLRQVGCTVSTLRYGFDSAEYDRLAPALVVLSPGPARPDDFGMRDTFAELERRGLPAFGVCLGLQGMVEYCGGRLAQLATPMHGKASAITGRESPLFAGLPRELRVGRYHSLYADPSALPDELEILATAQDGTIMAVAHKQRPWSAVQFHPESILSADQGHGLRLIQNLVELIKV